jgi:hypothetical protein
MTRVLFVNHSPAPIVIEEFRPRRFLPDAVVHRTPIPGHQELSCELEPGHYIIVAAADAT